MTVFDIIGPIMIGPSSSHTAGAVRIGRTARKILNDKPVSVRILLSGSFAQTYRGHGTDKALIAGIMGFHSHDERIPKALEIAKERIKTRFSVQLSQLKGELLSEVSAQKAISIFYGREDISESIRVKNDMIYKIMSTPKIALDSVCYMRMNKNE